MKWNYINSLDDITNIKQKSTTIPQIILKHSTSCSISSMAKMRLEDRWSSVKTEVEFHYLDLLANRNISSYIAEHFEVNHESPQLILISKGEVIYDASHFDISIQELNESLDYHFAE